MYSFENVDTAFLRKRAHGKWGQHDEDVISLSVADLDFPPPKAIEEGIIQTARETRAPYANLNGDPDVLAVIAEKIAHVNNIPATEEMIYMVPGTMFGIFLSCFATLTKGDEAIICPAPVYGPFMMNIKMMKATPRYVPVVYDRKCELDIQALRDAITPRTRLLMVCNPHNPTGRVLTRDELTAIAEIAEEHDLVIFSDEVYEDMVLDGEHISIASLSEETFERTITVFGFSKAFAIPAYRCAYVLAHPKRMKQLKSMMIPIFCHLDTLAQGAAKAATLAREPWLTELNAHLRKMRNLAHERLNAMRGVSCDLPEATPFIFPDISSFGCTAAELRDIIQTHARVIVTSGTDFGIHGEGHIRLTIGTSPALLTKALDRIEDALSTLTPRS